MTHDDALLFLNQRLNYESRGMPDQVELRVDRTALLLERLDRPHDRYRIVHVAGTKGKGSTSTMIAALLRDAGFRVGLHTSPHLRSIEERFQINGVPISKHDLASLVAEIAPAVHHVDRSLHPRQPELTFFEITTALTLLHFARANVDAAVVEVGMGGRLDSTNVVDPDVCVITNISLDHTRQLGNTLAQIAREKAGIIKPGKVVVSGVVGSEPRSPIVDRCELVGATLREVGRDFGHSYRDRGLDGGDVDVWTWRRRWPALKLAPIGYHQAVNASVALAAVDALADAGVSFRTDRLGQSLERLSIPGRFEILARNPLLVFDVAHNPASFAAMRDSLDAILPTGHRGRRILVFASSRDKDWRRMLDAVKGRFDTLVITQFSGNPRALPVADIESELIGFPASLITAPSAEDALRLALAQLTPRKLSALGDQGRLGIDQDVVCVAGSFYLVAELRDRRPELATVTSP